MRYMGSKRRLAKYLLPIILEYREPGQYYVEPFCGGMNMMEHVDGPRIANDSNHYLMAMWRALLDGWTPPTELSKDDYYKIRKYKDFYPDHLVGFVGFGCSFGGMWFSSYAQDKRGDNYCLQSHNSVIKQVKKLVDVKLFCGNYLDLYIPENSIIYCDPPYAGTTKYKDDFDHDSFWVWCRRMSRRGYMVYVSEYNAPSDFVCVWQKQVNVPAAGMGKAPPAVEKLFTLF
jgi:DNA adenine methylase